ncbi:MAG: amidohydrolase [bacterium]|nr:amidohydrolase [bacterium]
MFETNFNVIDFHVHPVINKNPLKTMKEIMMVARKFHISKLCLLGDVLRFGYNPDEKQVSTINNLTIKLVKNLPEFLVGFCFLNPENSHSFIQEEIERCIVKENFKGIKLEAAVNATSKKLDFVMEIACRLNILVVHHSWNTDIINNRKHQSDPEDIANLASRFPQVKIVMAHITAASQRGVVAIQPYKNVWVDTSGAQPVSGTIEYAVKHLGAERILYGSDVPGRDFSVQLAKIIDAQISEKEKRMILGENTRKLLGI